MELIPFSEKHEGSIIDSTARINIWEGAVRSAKTIASIIRWLEYIERDAPPGRLHMVGKTEKTLRMNVLDPIEEMVGERSFRVNRGDGTARYKGRKIWLLGANDERAETKIKGATSAGIYGDQLEIWPESFFKMAISRISLEGAKLFGTANPDSPYHWLKKFIDRKSEEGMDLLTWGFELDDNKALPPAYISALKAEYGPVGSVYYQRFILGRWVVAEGAVWPQFDEGRHVLDVIPPAIDLLDRQLAMDWGTTNPTTVLCGEVRLDTDGIERIYITGQYWHDSQAVGQRQKTTGEYSKEIGDWIEGFEWSRFRIDPSAAAMIRQFRSDGWVGIGQANNRVGYGLQVVAMLFQMDRIRIHRSCIHLIEEVLGYVWDPKAQVAGKDEPLKVSDHGPDALRYLVMGFRRFWRKWVTLEPQSEEVIAL